MGEFVKRILEVLKKYRRKNGNINRIIFAARDKISITLDVTYNEI